MSKVTLKVARIGNSRGVRIPAATLTRYHIGANVTMEEQPEGILLRPQGRAPEKLTWDETAVQMAATAEDWRAWDAVTADGLETVPWVSPPLRRVAEPARGYRGKAKANVKRRAKK